MLYISMKLGFDEKMKTFLLRKSSYSASEAHVSCHYGHGVKIIVGLINLYVAKEPSNSITL